MSKQNNYDVRNNIRYSKAMADVSREVTALIGRGEYRAAYRTAALGYRQVHRNLRNKEQTS